METISQQAANLQSQWETDQRWATIERTYTAQDVIRLARFRGRRAHPRATRR